jgi:hypothetical protein
VRDLLELARLDAHRFSLEATAVELHDLVEACVDGFGPEADAAAAAAEADSETDAPDARATDDEPDADDADAPGGRRTGPEPSR